MTIKQADVKQLITSALILYPAMQEIKPDAYGTTTIPQSARLPAGVESLLTTLPCLSVQVVTTLQAVVPVATYSTVQVLQVPPTISFASEKLTFFTTSSLYKSEIKQP
jgi:hypothetical protein